MEKKPDQNASSSPQNNKNNKPTTRTGSTTPSKPSNPSSSPSPLPSPQYHPQESKQHASNSTPQSTASQPSQPSPQSTKQSPSGWVVASTTVLDFVPIVGTVKSLSQAYTGKEWFTNEEVNRGVELACAVPYGKVMKGGAKVGKKIVKGGAKLAEETAKKVKWIFQSEKVEAKVVQQAVKVEEQRMSKAYVGQVEKKITSLYNNNIPMRDAALKNAKEMDIATILGDSHNYSKIKELETFVSNMPPKKSTNYINSNQVLQRSVKEPGPYHNFPESFCQHVLKTGERKEVPGYFRYYTTSFFSSIFIS